MLRMQPMSSLRRLLLNKKFVLSILVITLFFTAILLINSYYMINTVVISSDDDIQLLRGVESYKGKNSFLLQSKSIEKDVFDQNPTVEEVKVTIQLPDVLKMVITTAEPVASLSATQGYVVLNKKGRILEKIKSNEQRKQAIPPIRFFQKLNYI